MSTAVVKFSEKAIQRAMRDSSAGILRDPALTGVRLKIHKSRTTGSWTLLKNQNGKTIWKRLGSYPAIPVSWMIKNLPDVLAGNIDVIGQFYTIGDMLDWFLTRSNSEESKSKERKSSIESSINCHLTPRLGHCGIDELSQGLVDRLLIWPLQGEYKPSYINGIFKILKQAANLSTVLELVSRNPLQNIILSKSIKTDIAPKAPKILPYNLPDVIKALNPTDRQGFYLVVIMLFFGTRIGETRLAKWKDINWSGETWFIPAANTKTNQDHHLPLTTQSMGLFRAYKSEEESKGRGKKNDPIFYTNSRLSVSKSTANNWVQIQSHKVWTAHDLRKVARTIWADLEVDSEVAENLLNHKKGKLQAAYVHTKFKKQKQAALQCYHDHLDSIGLQAILSKPIPSVALMPKQENPSNDAASEGVIALTIEEHVI